MWPSIEAGLQASIAAVLERPSTWSGRILAPGFIDGHVHIESSMVTVPEYARAVVPRGTTTVIADPHEIANVWGEAGVRYMLESSRDVPLNVFVMLPSCVPATNLETAGAALDADALAGLMQEEGVLGLAEVMNYPGVIYRDPEVMKKIRLAGGNRIDGHAPGLEGPGPLRLHLCRHQLRSRVYNPCGGRGEAAPGVCTSCFERAAPPKTCWICCRWSPLKTPANSFSSRTTGIRLISWAKGISTSW